MAIKIFPLGKFGIFQLGALGLWNFDPKMPDFPAIMSIVCRSTESLNNSLDLKVMLGDFSYILYLLPKWLIKWKIRNSALFKRHKRITKDVPTPYLLLISIRYIFVDKSNLWRNRVFSTFRRRKSKKSGKNIRKIMKVTKSARSIQELQTKSIDQVWGENRIHVSPFWDLLSPLQALGFVLPRKGKRLLIILEIIRAFFDTQD